MKIFQSISKLLTYAQQYLGLNSADAPYVLNNVLDVLNLRTFEYVPTEASGDDIDSLLLEFAQNAVEEGVIEKGQESYYCDKIMGMLSLMPSRVDDIFQNTLNVRGGQKAMDWLYGYCVANNYVKKAVLDKNPRFDSNGLVVTINLAKPEFRDPKKAASGNSVAGGYPKCVICRENEGFAPRNKCTLRTVSLTLGGKPWFWQFSPYGYFSQHGIAVNMQHVPMGVDRETVSNLLEFVDTFPHYFIGCNAALERIGGSVLGHDHYQGGGEILPLHKAIVKRYFSVKSYEELTVGILDWPGTALRICGRDKQKICDLTDKIRRGWATFTDESQGIVCKTEKGQHNAISPTAIKKGDRYEMNVILRSNITSHKYPDGVFHAHPEFHVIKKESIGLIEAQGLFILPGRLVEQLAKVEQCIVTGQSLSADLNEFDTICNETAALARSCDAAAVHAAMQLELGSICYRILQNTAVFKTEEKFALFLQSLGFVQK
ncbi:MAG: hypothetical protein NC132_03970 [Corallococcus sp.]|nr:hypothetical protein [Corallococcus sp.]MCM1359815.1 hypothetical protein [Corallococcus sp.]MCM1395249.1 hypothetical protein [Corallococcus sp.]